MLELIVVMVLIATILAIASPSLRGFVSSRKLDEGTSQMLALMNHARSQAINEGVVIRFNLDEDAGEFWLTVQEGAEFVEIEDDFGRRFLLPENITAEWLTEMEMEDNATFTVFYPTGRTQPGELRLTSIDGRIAELICESATEMYRARTIEELNESDL